VTPLTTDRQLVVDASVAVSPSATVFRYWDYWGTLVHAFDVHRPHTELVVTGVSVVETSPPRPTAAIGWDEVRRAAEDQYAELLAPTPHVPLNAELAEVASELSRSADPVTACAGVVEWVHGRLGYAKGTTTVSTDAWEALGIGSGVCQDFAHLALALLRSMGIPARYASGYTFPSSHPEVGQDAVGESHAWVEAWTGDWQSLDPTHLAPVGERHVLVARGRDYADVAPLKGIYRGAPAEDLEVTVELSRLA
jgi:transglutaminase-like putative cysteine protease